MAKTTELSRKARILDAAERAFADLGFEGASLRIIVRQARVNLATVYYYFGSKEGLMTAVVARRFDPLRIEHLELLRRFDAEAGGGPLPVEKIVEAMVLPPLQLAAEAGGQTPVAMRLIGRIVTEPNPQTQDRLRSLYADVREAFRLAFRRRLPHLPEADLCWRIQFVWGALAFILCNPRKVERESNGACHFRDARAVVAQLITCFGPGIQAPAVTPAETTKISA